MTPQWYREYLQSPQWQAKRKTVLSNQNNICACCKSTQKLNVHHLSYKNIGNEKPNELVILCEDCHKITHEFGGGTNGILALLGIKHPERSKAAKRNLKEQDKKKRKAEKRRASERIQLAKQSRYHITTSHPAGVPEQQTRTPR